MVNEQTAIAHRKTNGVSRLQPFFQKPSDRISWRKLLFLKVLQLLMKRVNLGKFRKSCDREPLCFLIEMHFPNWKSAFISRVWDAHHFHRCSHVFPVREWREQTRGITGCHGWGFSFLDSKQSRKIVLQFCATVWKINAFHVFRCREGDRRNTEAAIGRRTRLWKTFWFTY